MPRRNRAHSNDREEDETTRLALAAAVATMLLVGLILVVNGLMK